MDDLPPQSSSTVPGKHCNNNNKCPQSFGRAHFCAWSCLASVNALICHGNCRAGEQAGNALIKCCVIMGRHTSPKNDTSHGESGPPPNTRFLGPTQICSLEGTSVSSSFLHSSWLCPGGSVAEWLACWTLAQKGPGSNRRRDAVG